MTKRTYFSGTGTTTDLPEPDMSVKLTQAQIDAMKDCDPERASLSILRRDGRLVASLHLMTPKQHGEGYHHEHVPLVVGYMATSPDGIPWGCDVSGASVALRGKLARPGDTIDIDRSDRLLHVEAGYALRVVEVTLSRMKKGRRVTVASWVDKAEVDRLPEPYYSEQVATAKA